ncbi:MAG: hypothetical protein LBS89_05320, partial [Zoogloeaceae bacterium]|nr:hypothetical protein [Zoogloeaceae bacterium]
MNKAKNTGETLNNSVRPELVEGHSLQKQGLRQAQPERLGVVQSTLTWDEIQANALAFSKRWKDGWDEKSDAQNFVRDFLAVFGVQDARAVGRFEERAQREGGRGFMDYFWQKEIAIEMKTKGKDLSRAYEQLKDYV